MLQQQTSKPCGGNSFIFLALLTGIFATVSWLFFLMFQADTKKERPYQSSTGSSSELYRGLTQSNTTQNEYYTSTSVQPPQKVKGVNSALPQGTANKLDNNKTNNKISQLQDKLSAQQREIKHLTQQNNQLKTGHQETRSNHKQQLDSINGTLLLNNNAREELAFIQQELSHEKSALALKKKELNEVLEYLHVTKQLTGQQVIEIENREKELTSLKKQLSNTDIQISDLKNRFTVFEMKQEILFDKAEAQLNNNGKQAISSLAKIFRQFPDRQIAIQGHTDNQAVGKRLQNKFSTNWELAAARSASAIHYLQQVEKINPERMILVSYAQYRPIRSNESTKDQANNRRIEVILMPKDFDFFRETTD